MAVVFYPGAVERVLFTARSRALGLYGRQFREVARGLAPVDTGFLASMIRLGPVSGGARFVNVTALAFYSMYQETGTGIYFSERYRRFFPRGGRTTPWTYYNSRFGGFVYTRGNRPQSYMLPALDLMAIA